MSERKFLSQLVDNLRFLLVPNIAISLATKAIFYKWFIEKHGVILFGSDDFYSIRSLEKLILESSDDYQLANAFANDLDTIYRCDYRFFHVKIVSDGFNNDKNRVEAIKYVINSLIECQEDSTALFKECFQILRVGEFSNRFSNTSDSVNLLISGLLMIDREGDDELKTIYDPATGYGNSLLSIANQYKNAFIYGQEIHNETAVFTIMNLMVNGIEDFDIRVGDTLLHPQFIQDDNVKRFDLVVAHPPYRVRNYNRYDSEVSDPYHRWSQDIGGDSYLDAAFFSHIIASISKGGRAAVVVPNSFLTNQTRAEHIVRRQIVESGLLKAVIHLPSKIEHQISIQSSILLLGAFDFVPNRTIYFIDGKYNYVKINNQSIGFNEEIVSKHVESLLKLEEKKDYSVLVNRTSIIENDYFLHAGHYFVENYLNSFSSVTDKSNKYIQLGSVLTNLKLERPTDDKLSLKVITPQDLNNNIKLLLDRIDHRGLRKNHQILNQSAFLLSIRNRELVFSYFEYENQPIALSPLVTAYLYDENKVTLPYLAKQFTEEYFKYVTSNYFTGTAFLRLNTRTLFSFQIKVESLQEQLQIEEQLLKYFHQSDKNLDILEQSKSIIQEENAYLRHSIAGPLSNIKAFYEKLIQLFQHNPDVKVSDVINGNILKGQRFDFHDMDSIIKRDLNRINDFIKHQIDLNNVIQQAKLEALDIDVFLDNYVRELKQRRPNLEIVYESFVKDLVDDIAKEDYVTALANEGLLQIVLDNLVDNAEKHAFVDGEPHRIEVALFYDQELDEFGFEVSNTGRPFPTGFSWDDYLAKGRKAGEQAGTGYGGWYINQIIQKFNGKIEMDDNQILKEEVHNGYVTSIQIVLPLVGGENGE